MRSSLIYGILGAALAVNARVAKADDAATSSIECKDTECAVTLLPVGNDTQLLLPRIEILPPEEAAAGEEAGAEGSATAAKGGNTNEGAVDGGNGASDDGQVGGTDEDGRWGAGRTGSGDDSASGDGETSETAEMTDEDELTNVPGSPPANEAVYDRTQAWKQQTPLPGFENLFRSAKMSFAWTVRPDQTLFWSAGADDIRAEGERYTERAIQLSASGQVVPGGLLPMAKVFLEPLYQNWPKEIMDSLISGGNAAKHQFWDIVSAALAAASSGKVYVLLPDEGTKDAGVWITSEFPQLQLNTAVTEIYRVNPESAATTLIWSRTDGYTDPISHPWPLGKPLADTTVWPLRA